MTADGSLFQLSFGLWFLLAGVWFAGVAAAIYLVVRLESRRGPR
jgi:hypothetical protein